MEDKYLQWVLRLSLGEHNFSSPVHPRWSFQTFSLDLQEYGIYFCLYFIYVLSSQRGVSTQEFG